MNPVDAHNFVNNYPNILPSEIIDYRVNNTPLLFLAAGGRQTQCAYVQVVDDNITEPTEYFILKLTSGDDSVVVINSVANVFIMDE